MLRLSSAHRREMIALARTGFPNEVCGLLAGDIRGEEKILRVIYRMRNVDECPEHFSMDPEEQFRVFADIRNRGLRLLGNFHSHPFTPARPSEEDIRLAYDPSLSYVIISLGTPEPVLKSFIIMGGTVWEEIQRPLVESRIS